MNRYNIEFKIMDGDTYLGRYTAQVEAESIGEAERKAVRQLREANIQSKHEYLADKYHDMGPVNEEGPSE